MAINQVSLFFYAPRWQQRLTPTDGQTIAGEAMALASAVPIEGADDPRLDPDAVRAWFAERGFAAVDWGNGSVFQRGQVRSVFGSEQEIIVHVHDEAGEVAELYCRFTLARKSPPPLSEWAELVTALCWQFGFQLGAEGAAPCSEQEFLAAVFRNENYRRFAESFGWHAPE